MKRRVPLRSDPDRQREFVQRGRKPIARRTPMKRVNPKRKLRRFEIAYLSVHYVGFIHWKGCVVPGCTHRPIHAAHRVRRYPGPGTWRDIFGACYLHHAVQHQWGIDRFAERFGLDLEAICAANVFEWRAFTWEV